MLKLFKELKRRKVLTTLGVYAGAAFIIIQVAEIVFPRLLIPDWAVTFIIVLIILGFPVTFFLSWTYDLRRDADTDDKSGNKDAESDKKSKNMLLPITGFLTIIGGAFWVWYSLGSMSQGSDMDKKIFQSIAVLYIENLSNDPKNENICAGLTTSITTALSRLGRYKVKARTDVLKFRNKITSHEEIHDILGVDAYIEGSIIKPPGSNKYNANITLIDAERGNNLWAKEYSKTAEEILTIPNTIVSEVSKFLSGEEIADISPLDEIHQQGDDETFSLLGRGINLLDSGEYGRSIPVFDSLLLKDPDNMRAVFSKGQAFENLGEYSKALQEYKQMLPVDDQNTRIQRIWTYPYFLEHDYRDISVYEDFMFSEKLNIQLFTIRNESDKTTEIFALDMQTNSVVWNKMYRNINITPKIVGDNLVITASSSTRHKQEAAIYIHNLLTGNRIFSKEFTKDHAEQRVLFTTLKKRGAEIPEYNNSVFLFIRRDNYYNLVMLAPDENIVRWEKTIPLQGVVEGDPLIYLVESSNKYYVLHQKGLNLYLYNAEDGAQVWHRTLLDDTDNVLVHNDEMIFYSSENAEVTVQNVLSQQTIGKYELDAPTLRAFSRGEDVIVHTKNSITSLKTYKPFLRNINNWTTKLNDGDEVEWIFDVVDNLFVFTKSGDLYCIDGAGGNIVNTNQLGIYTIENAVYHHDETSKSFIIYADGFLIGLDPYNGRTMWKIRELFNIEYWWWAYNNIYLLENKLIVIKNAGQADQIIIKAYSRSTGELLWTSNEKIFRVDSEAMSTGSGFHIPPDKLKYKGRVINQSLYIGTSTDGVYSVDLSWKPDKNYIPKNSLFNRLASCYNNLNKPDESEKLLKHIIDAVDQQNEIAFKQLSELYLNRNELKKFLDIQADFFELVIYDDIKRGKIEESMKKHGGLLWVRPFQKVYEYAVQLQRDNLLVALNCGGGGDCSISSFRSNSGIPIWEKYVDIQNCIYFTSAGDNLLFIDRVERLDKNIYTLHIWNTISKVDVAKISLYEGSSYYRPKKIYNFDSLHILDADLDNRRYLTAVNSNNGAFIWENEYETYPALRIKNLSLVRSDSLLLLSLSEQIQAINLFTGTEMWLFEYDDVEGIDYLGANSIDNNVLSFISDDDEYISINMQNQEVLFQEPIDFIGSMDIAYLNQKYILCYSPSGKVVLYERRLNEIIERWSQNLNSTITILKISEDNIYVEDSDNAVIKVLNLQSGTIIDSIHLIWPPRKIFIDKEIISIFGKRKFYSINIGDV